MGIAARRKKFWKIKRSRAAPGRTRGGPALIPRVEWVDMWGSELFGAKSEKLRSNPSRFHSPITEYILSGPGGHLSQ